MTPKIRLVSSGAIVELCQQHIREINLSLSVAFDRFDATAPQVTYYDWRRTLSSPTTFFASNVQHSVLRMRAGRHNTYSGLNEIHVTMTWMMAIEELRRQDKTHHTTTVLPARYRSPVDHLSPQRTVAMATQLSSWEVATTMSRSTLRSR